MTSSARLAPRSGGACNGDCCGCVGSRRGSARVRAARSSTSPPFAGFGASRGCSRNAFARAAACSRAQFWPRFKISSRAACCSRAARSRSESRGFAGWRLLRARSRSESRPPAGPRLARVRSDVASRGALAPGSARFESRSETKPRSAACSRAEIRSCSASGPRASLRVRSRRASTTSRADSSSRAETKSSADDRSRPSTRSSADACSKRAEATFFGSSGMLRRPSGMLRRSSGMLRRSRSLATRASGRSCTTLVRCGCTPPFGGTGECAPRCGGSERARPRPGFGRLVCSLLTCRSPHGQGYAGLRVAIQPRRSQRRAHSNWSARAAHGARSERVG